MNWKSLLFNLLLKRGKCDNSTTGNLGIGTTGPSGLLTLNQGAADGEIFNLKSSDVAHGMTTETETDTYAYFKKPLSTGGLQIGAYEGSNQDYAFVLRSVAATTNTAKSGQARAPIIFDVAVKSGTGTASPSANGNLIVIRDTAANLVRFIFDVEGDSHQDVGTAWTNFDSHEDPVMARDLAMAVTRQDDPLAEKFNKFLKYDKEALEQADLVTFNADGHHFVNMSKLAMLHTGSIWQIFSEQKQKENVLDLAEEYDVSEDVAAGTVLTVDTEHDNRLAPSTKPHQVVAGVVSYHKPHLKNAAGSEYLLPEGHPKLKLHTYTNPQPVALTGIVPTKVTNTNGAIKRGDILVTSSKKEYAMRVDENLKMTINNRYIVGVALQDFNQEAGIINVQR